MPMQKQQHQPNISSSSSTAANPSEELLQLRLDNSELRSRLESHTDESKSELLQLLEEQTSQTNLLQSKCDELAAGFIEIDKERRALRKSADDARHDATQMVEQLRDECEQRCTKLEGHLLIREKEVEKLAERTREQERRIETVVNESADKQSKIEIMEGELEELIGMVENEREKYKEFQGEYDKVVDIVGQKDIELGDRKVAEQGLEHQLKEFQQQLEGEISRGKSREEELAIEVQGKVTEITSMEQDKQLTKIEHEQAVQTMQETHHANFKLQQQSMIDVHQNEKDELANTLQLQIDDKSLTIQTLKSDIDLLQSKHSSFVAEMEVNIKACKGDTASTEKKYQESRDTTSQLQDKLKELMSINQIAQEDLKAANYLLEKENEKLTEELNGAKVQLADVNDKLSSQQNQYAASQLELASCVKQNGDLAKELNGTRIQLDDANDKLSSLENQYAALQSEHASLKQNHAEQVSTLENQLTQKTIEYDEKISEQLKQVSTIEAELKEEKNVSNKLRSQLREVNIQLKEDVSAHQKESRMLEEGLESINERLLAKEEELAELQTKYEAEVSDCRNEVESLKTDHAAQIMVIETRGADIVSDLEDAIGELESELANYKRDHEQEMNKVKQTMVDKEERVEHASKEQQDKIVSLTTYAKEKKEEVKMLKNELARAKQTIESTTREKEDTMANVRDELKSARARHEQEMSDLQHIVDDVRVELSMAKDRIASEDSELTRTKATLGERTNLLRDMVQQTTAYQCDYEREHQRATTLEEAVQSYKMQLAEARDDSQRLEHEVQDKDTHYCDAIRNERQQRLAMESELESSRQLVEDARRQRAEMEKENSALKDKVSRQEKYIGRLQDKDKQNRRTTMNTTRMARPSTVGTYSPTRSSPIRKSSKDRVSKSRQEPYARNENSRPNTSRAVERSGRVPSDELESLLG